MIVDGAVVMMENSMRRLGATGRRRDVIDTVIRAAAHEVARPIVFAVAIIIAVYMPIFFLEGLEGRMFRPMAVTVVFGAARLTGPGVDGGAGAGDALPSATGSRSIKEGWFEHCARRYRRVAGWCAAPSHR